MSTAVAVLCNFAKVFESVLYKTIYCASKVQTFLFSPRFSLMQLITEENLMPDLEPQGSHMGALLLLLFANDLSLSLTKNFLFTLATIKSTQDCFNLQENIKRLNEWCIKTKLAVNIFKCKAIIITCIKNSINFSYILNNQRINSSNTSKDLEVAFYQGLIFISNPNMK